MSRSLAATLIDDAPSMTLAELARACRAREEQVQVWVVEGVLQPTGGAPQDWRFSGAALRRARLAISLSRDLEVNTPGIALALDLMEQIDALNAQLRRATVRG
ncbi:chaperone modulator CbpM [Rhizobacter sp. Root404]|uniref:chaperone modulator CbpM n=1 Tax=Rhizobacter sp. Root404 TaxID=1736528 RepID=UPI0006F7370D|nr:chaperone modulator CbpM [Rhizobacter sp. Root404]KQW35134.1 MerR family transcriptional regulator [Rhizobacter sp. Root404]